MNETGNEPTILTADVLPDSRAKVARGRVFQGGSTWIPVFCANCGVDGGWCPEESTFLFYLCNKCAETHGKIAGTMMMPDEVFFDRLKQEQLEAHGRYLSHDELVAVAQDDSTPLATLLKEAK